MRLNKTSLTVAALATGLASQAHAAVATFVTNSPYAQFSDSPFFGIGNGNPNFYLENFEDGLLNTPGVSAQGGFAVGVSPSIDSVDGDDGVFDGNGNAGHSWYSGGVVTSISFSFNAGDLGQLPTHAGIVWTNVGLTPNPPQGVDSIVLRAFDTNGVSLGGILFDNLGDGNVFGGSAEDRFFGAIFAGGISKITITSLGGSGDWEVDHLQYGIQAVPVPGAAWLLAPALFGLAGLRRKRV